MKNDKKLNYRDYEVILYPLLTEKSNMMTANAQYFFAVKKDATKPEIKKAVENLFQVKVSSVNTLIRKGKKKVFRGRRGMQSDAKKAMVCLAAGQKIDFSTGV
jgi:large subunit ribosomal protein L23